MIVLDTHAWVWWAAQSDELPARARQVIDEGCLTRSVYVSSISTWEVALLVERGRLELTMDVDDWIARSEALDFLHFVPVDNNIALRSTRLPAFHKDPADRIIIATALSIRAPVVTRDERMRRWPHVETIWS